MGVHHRGVLLPAERRLADEAFEQDATERVHVGRWTERRALELLGRRVLEGSDEHAGAGDTRTRGRALREPEVREVHVLDVTRAVRADDQDVAGLDVAMDQASGVSGVQRPSDAIDHRQRVVERQRRLIDESSEIRAGDVPHRDEQVAVVLARVVDGEDVRFVERGRELGFAHESVPEPLVVGELGGEHLEGDLPLESLVLGEVHDPHAPPPEGAIDAVASELASGC